MSLTSAGRARSGKYDLMGVSLRRGVLASALQLSLVYVPHPLTQLRPCVDGDIMTGRFIERESIERCLAATKEQVSEQVPKNARLRQ